MSHWNSREEEHLSTISSSGRNCLWVNVYVCKSFFFLTLDQGLSFLVFGCSWNERLLNLFPVKEMLIFLFNSSEPSAFALLYKEVLCFLAMLGEVEGTSFWTVKSMTPLLVLPTAGSRTPKMSLDFFTYKADSLGFMLFMVILCPGYS